MIEYVYYCFDIQPIEKQWCIVDYSKNGPSNQCNEDRKKFMADFPTLKITECYEDESRRLNVGSGIGAAVFECWCYNRGN